TLGGLASARLRYVRPPLRGARTPVQPAGGSHRGQQKFYTVAHRNFLSSLLIYRRSFMSKPAMRVAVTCAAGQIGYALLFRIASGEMLGTDQPVILQLLEIPDEKAQKALKGVMMELEDCAFPLLQGMTAHSDPREAFKDAD